ncbi:MAG: SDR family oxidoreductase [Armatimonadetes bacterium]|nr:SDR family oxidoreductase [Armatimonadota bacterium]
MSRRGPHITDLFDLTGKVVMVTGGAHNLGLDMAEALGEAGADLVITSREPAKAEAKAAELRGYLGVRVLPLGLNVIDEEAVAAAFAVVMAEYGRLDVLVCNAGGAKLTGGTSTDTIAASDWDYVVEVNLRGTFLCCRAAVPIMKAQGVGSIVIIASISGMVGRDRWVYEGSPDMIPNMNVYSAAKSGLIGYMRDVAAENGKYGIRANCISPGGFERGQPEEFIRRYSQQTPLGRMGKDGTDLKGAVVYLASEASGYVTGVNLPVDGGFTMW